MALPTATEFLLRFPEFSEQSLSVVESSLADAYALTPENVWGALQPQATCYLAAHLLGTRTMQIGIQVGSPSGNALGAGLQSTHYGQSYLTLREGLPLTGFAL